MKLLWVGDAACESGFSRATHETLEAFRLKGWDIGVLGINYRGDPHQIQRRYRLYPAAVPGGDMFGVRRLPEVLQMEGTTDVVVIQNDPWNIPAYLDSIDFYCEKTKKPRPFVVGAVAVDGLRCLGKGMNKLDHAIFWTQFAVDQARDGGYEKGASVVPLGVDTSVFKPGDRHNSWKRLGLPDYTEEGFYFLNVNRNQPRKHLELTVWAFADFLQWWKAAGRGKKPYLYMHVCPTGEHNVNLDTLAGYYGLEGHFILSEPDVYHGADIAELLATYRVADVMLTTTQGEGWGLPTLEGMACGVPQIVPDWSALGEWAKPAARLVSCNQIAVTPQVGVLGGLPDHDELVSAMIEFYEDASLRLEHSQRGLELANRPEYNWKNIGNAFEREVSAAYGHARA